jgi:hypothetical protein
VKPGVTCYPNLARRALELDLLQFPGTTFSFRSGKELVYRLHLSPSAASRIYTCDLHVRPGPHPPEIFVVHPDLKALASGRALPHVYPHAGKGAKLCLWRPGKHEWHASMKLSETYVPWTVQWLWYFEDWLQTGEWAGGGEHPATDNDRRRGTKKAAR